MIANGIKRSEEKEIKGKRIEEKRKEHTSHNHITFYISHNASDKI